MADEMKRIGRKLLIASLGVASVTYGACGGRSLPGPDAAADGAGQETGAAPRDAATDGADDGENHIVEPTDGSTDVSPDRQFVGNIIP
jgi:hypothetical protein